MHHAYDAQRWYAGPVDDDAPRSVPHPPPIDSTAVTPGEPRARWCRVEWCVETYPDYRGDVCAAIKAEAQRRIVAVMPEWKQRNATARMVEKLAAGETGDAEWVAGQAAWAWIKTVRQHSDDLEALVIAAPDPLQIDIAAGWPLNPGDSADPQEQPS
jgi:hypothetical protein